MTEVLLHEKSRQMGAKIKYYRTLGGMNQTILANKLGITYQHLRSIECGKQTPSFSLLIALAEELHVDMAELISNGRQLYY